MRDELLTYLYQFGVGGLIYFVSVGLLLRAGALSSDRRSRRRWLLGLGLAFLLYAVGLGLLQLLGPQTVLGGAQVAGRVAGPSVRGAP